MRTLVLFGGGIGILTLGIALTIESGLGASPFDALLVGLSEQVGLTVGSWEVLLALLMIGCNSLLSRRRPEFEGLLTAFITGIGIDLWLWLLRPLIDPGLWIGQLACFGAGLIVVGLGISLYLHAQFAPMPLDRLTLVLQTLTGLNLFVTRSGLYFIFLIAAFVVRGPIGLGTLLTVCLGGLILHTSMPLTGRALDRLQRQAKATDPPA
ncbi:YitT family protein [Paenibacillus aurantiacus]|uniref:YitT family protein n=1 Tax=Paenibacillus aurantiacus TaxID=1936118 RepID=A0ABV5KKG5_9BACL